MTPRTCLVVANEADADAGYVGERLERHGFRLRTLLREAGEVPPQLPITVEGADAVGAVLLLGSDWSVHSPTQPAVLTAECALVRSAQAEGVPVLGLCYGAQVVAHAFGGAVSLAQRPEIGWIDVQSEDARLVPPGPWLAFHLDVVELPPGARAVASNACGPQAFTLPGVLAVQFHPEVRPATLADWAGRAAEVVAAAGIDRHELTRQALEREPQSRAAAHALVDAFLERFPSPGACS